MSSNKKRSEENGSKNIKIKMQWTSTFGVEVSLVVSVLVVLSLVVCCLKTTSTSSISMPSSGELKGDSRSLAEEDLALAVEPLPP